MKIKIINPNTSQEMTQAIDEAGRSVARAGTEILTTCPDFGPSSIESFYDDVLAIPGLLDEIRKGESEDCDAYRNPK